MATFSYTAVMDSGKRVAGTLRTLSRQQAIQRLIGQGYHPLTLAPTEEGLASRRISLDTFRKVTVSDLSVFTRQLASLLQAGLPMVQALTTLHEQCECSALKKVIYEITEKISREGIALSDGLNDHPRVFNAVYRGIIRAGEEGGDLVPVLRSLATHLSRSARLRREVIGAFVYPAFILLLGSVAVFLLMAFVIPRFQELFASFGQALPWPTRILIACSMFLSQWWWAVALGMTIGLLILFGALRRGRPREILGRQFLRMPVLGRMIMKLEVARISRTLAALLNSGIRVLEALRITQDTARNLAIRRLFPEMIERVSNGEALAAAIQRHKVFPPLMVNLIRTGEETGELSEMLTELADIYEDEAERAVAAAVKLIEPLLIVIMGGIVAGIVAAVMLPIFRANVMVS